MGVLGLGEQVRGIGQLAVQQVHQLLASILGDVDPSLVEI
jgi:hypothetical protein